MLKKISEMTEADKSEFLKKTKQSMSQYGIPWSFMEEKILEDIENAFDDKKFAKLKGDARKDAELAREEFQDKNTGKIKKPSLVDYLLWTGKLMSGSEYVEF